MGFFLPMPPVAGGAVEKSWHQLARELARRGHAVTIISRTWKNWPQHETVDDVKYLRLRGHDHSKRLGLNLMLDLWWSIRVHCNLPPADIVVVNTISLACWLGRLRRKAGKVVVMLGRMPKGQFRFYRRPARIYVPSKPVQEAVQTEASRFGSLIRAIGYPINWNGLAHNGAPIANQPVTLGFVGRIHQEKGLHLLLKALQKLAKEPLPLWRAFICGPDDVSRGGSGADYLSSLRQLAPSQVEFLPPVFDEAALHAVYREIDVFCYPSLAAQGETFGVAVAEAMAAGAVPVVSNLPCFLDFVDDGKTGMIFNPHAPDAISELTALLRNLVQNEFLRKTLGSAAQTAVKRYDLSAFVDMLESDFAQLTGNPTPSCSKP